MLSYKVTNKTKQKNRQQKRVSYVNLPLKKNKTNNEKRLIKLIAVDTQE